MLNVPEGFKLLSMSTDFTSATWNIIATHEIFIVTGVVHVKITAHCTGNLAGATATVQLGVESATTNMIGVTTGTDMVAEELWYDTSPTTQIDTPANANIERIINGLDIGYEVVTAALTSGSIQFICEWKPLEPGATITVGAGGTL